MSGITADEINPLNTTSVIVPSTGPFPASLSKTLVTGTTSDYIWYLEMKQSDYNSYYPSTPTDSYTINSTTNTQGMLSLNSNPAETLPVTVSKGNYIWTPKIGASYYLIRPLSLDFNLKDIKYRYS